MKKLLIFLLGISFPAVAAGVKLNLPEAPIDRTDYASLQRGAAVYVNNCMGCHSAQFVRFDHIRDDLKINEQLIEKYLHFGTKQIGDSLVSSMSTEDATTWFNQAAAPDLSLSARLRGSDWLYAYLKGFYRDEAQPSGWNNVVFPNVAMPHVFSNLQGTYKLDLSNLSEDSIAKLDKNEVSIYDLLNNNEAQLTLEKQGLMNSQDFDLMVVDLVRFMDYMADPDRPARHRAGYIILSVLMVLLVFSYFLYRDYWREVH